MSRNNRVHRALVRTLVAALTLGVAVLAGCGVRMVRFVHHPATAKVVVVEKGHQHTAKCGHYKYQGQWYKAKKHKHGKKCGHQHRDGVWVYKP
jgi:uncharacterized low-complexity protein